MTFEERVWLWTTLVLGDWMGVVCVCEYVCVCVDDWASALVEFSD